MLRDPQHKGFPPQLLYPRPVAFVYPLHKFLPCLFSSLRITIPFVLTASSTHAPILSASLFASSFFFLSLSLFPISSSPSQPIFHFCLPLNCFSIFLSYPASLYPSSSCIHSSLPLTLPPFSLPPHLPLLSSPPHSTLPYARLRQSYPPRLLTDGHKTSY